MSDETTTKEERSPERWSARATSDVLLRRHCQGESASGTVGG